jgi:predicted nucleotidyltransferase
MHVKNEVIQAMIDLAQTYHSIQKIMLFGSRARGDHHETSDIDLAIWSTESISEFVYILEEQLPTLLEFDISHMEEVENPLFIEQVLKEGIVLYEKSRL